MRWSAKNSLFPDAGRRLTLGLGLIGIGKPWGHVDDKVPAEAQVNTLLETAMELGVRFFDTAPSYGVSEERFGQFLRNLPAATRNTLTLATKFGEHWDAARQQPYVDHSYDALTKSLDGSLERLGPIDFLELHKTTPDALASRDVERAFAYAKSVGVENVGASVSDAVSGEMVVRTKDLSVVQFPFNPASVQFRELASKATKQGFLVLTNRPFGMGRLLHEERPLTPLAAFKFLVEERFEGIVLTGTKSPAHLRANWEAFQAALHESPKEAA